MEFEKIREITAAQMGKSKEEITLETRYVEDLNADSLDLFEIVAALDDFYGIELPIEDAADIKTVGDAVEQLKKVLNK